VPDAFQKLVKPVAATPGGGWAAGRVRLSWKNTKERVHGCHERATRRRLRPEREKLSVLSNQGASWHEPSTFTLATRRLQLVI